MPPFFIIIIISMVVVVLVGDLSPLLCLLHPAEEMSKAGKVTVTDKSIKSKN